MTRAFHVYPAMTAASVDDTSAVILGSGAMFLGLTVAEAREVSQQLATAADDVEAQLSKRHYVRQPRDAREFFESEQSPSDVSFR